MLRFICFAMAIGLSVSHAAAALNAGFDIIVDINDDPVFPGHVVQDLMVNTTTDWGTAQLLVTITNDTVAEIYQDPNGSDFKPNPLLFDSFPSLEFDTYLDGNNQQPGLAGQAVDLGGDVQAFSNSHIDVLWYNTAQDDTDTFGIGRFTLSDNAIGTWSLMITADLGFQANYQGLINDGQFDLRNTGGGEPIDGDLDEDGFVGINDLNLVLGDWNNTIFTGDPAMVGDLNGDFFVGIDDLNAMLANWNQNVFPGDASAGDINGDGFVGIDDLNTLLGNWNLLIPSVDPWADPTLDGFVGIDDLNLVLGNWNLGVPPAANSSGAAVPEPGTAVVIGLVSLMGMSRRVRR